ncbi:MAG: hypothetical protein R2737_03150 [Candidatus Nanopelagicales bacterium]
MTGLVAQVAVALAGLGGEDSPSPTPVTPDAPPIDPERVTPGILGLISFVFLVVAVWLLYRSMRSQMAKVRPDLPGGPEDPDQPPDQDGPPGAGQPPNSGQPPKSPPPKSR